MINAFVNHINRQSNRERMRNFELNLEMYGNFGILIKHFFLFAVPTGTVADVIVYKIFH